MVDIDEGRFDSIFESIGFSKNEIKVYLDFSQLIPIIKR